ncbi:MAG: competence/damage-inducible protein A [Culturomica sp.]|jgi:nicotinamide-nucleotide amidase|nr:competence/damage-inducible protein A [Culturomica sp.]
MKAILITIGDEILIGQVLDTNAHYISGKLTKAGFEVIRKYTIGDEATEIVKTVDESMQAADLVIVTGGLGPTRDDLTKNVLAEYFGKPLKMNEEALEWIKELLANRGVPMNEKNVDQALMPEGVKILRNFKGTAAGMWFEKDGKSLISLPGVPFEMEHLMETYVLPSLKELYPDIQIDYKTVKVYDIPESELAIRIEEWEKTLPEGVGLAYLPAPGWVRLRLTAKGKMLIKLDDFYSELKVALQGLYFTEGEDSNIENDFGKVLKSKQFTVATAESCTGGYIAHLITSVSGSSDYFKGSVVSYANEVKHEVLKVSNDDLREYGAVSEQVVRQMAEGVRALMKTDCAIATSGVAGPNGGTPEKPVGTVWIAVATPVKTVARKFAFSFTRERNIAKASTKAMEILIEEISVPH